MADSFYGGRPGFSFIIVLNYASVDEMVECFKQGPDYTTVHFDEHILINTENKNDPDNGKIYRRGYDYSNDMGGAVYVGTIVGPAGRAPLLELTTIEEVKAKQAEEGYDYRYSEGSYAPFDNLIPGRDGDEYNDEIQWACCSIRDELNNDTTAYIGFILPYTVIDYEADSVSPYYNRSNDTDDFTNEDLVDRIDEGEHPYWEKWHISIPKGIKGESYNNFRVMIADDTIQDYPNKTDDINNQREVLVCDYYNYDKDESGEPVTIYLGNYNMITDISISDDGTITIHYTHDNDQDLDTKIKWIDNITMDTHGTVTVTYNDGSTDTFANTIYWIDDMYIQTADESGEEGTGDQRLHVLYDTGEEQTIGEPLNYIMKMSMVDSDYHLLVWYSDPVRRQEAIDSGNSYTFDGKDGWFDLGAVKDESGILIGLNISLEEHPELTDLADIIAYLNQLYPNGLTDSVDLLGKIITVGENESNKQFYAFDYNYDEEGKYKGWYYLGCFNVDSANLFFFADENDEGLSSKQRLLDAGGIWFVLED